MEYFEIIILFGILILLFYFNSNNSNKTKKSIKKHKQPKYDPKMYIDLSDHKYILYKKDDLFYKTHFGKNLNDSEREILDRGKITRHSIIQEQGGSKEYNKLKVPKKISSNNINFKENYLSYAKLPAKIK